MANPASILLRVGGDSSQFEAVIGRAQARLSAFGKSIQNVGAKVGNIGKGLSVAAGAMSAPLIGAVASFVSAADAAAKLSDKLGISVESLSMYQYALSQNNIDTAVFTNSIKSMSNIIAKQGTEAAKMAESIGLSLSDLAGLSPEAAFEKIADALNGVEDHVTKMAAA